MTLTQEMSEVTGDYVLLDGERYYRITNSHLMPDFFMTLVGASDHWMFVSSRGALTTGRCDPDSALFPYASDDLVSSGQSNTGVVTLVRMQGEALEAGAIWEPFSTDSAATTDQIRHNLYKTPLGNKLVFEEVNETKQLLYHR